MALFRIAIGATLCAFFALATVDATASTFTYTGKPLKAYRKKMGVPGIPGATHLTITATGSIPAVGQCSQETITGLTDGANSLVDLMAQGWIYQPGLNIFQVCANGKKGKLSVSVEVNLESFVNGALVGNWFVDTPDSPAGTIDLDEFGLATFPPPYYEADANFKIGTLTVSQ